MSFLFPLKVENFLTKRMTVWFWSGIATWSLSLKHFVLCFMCLFTCMDTFKCLVIEPIANFPYSWNISWICYYSSQDLIFSVGLKHGDLKTQKDIFSQKYVNIKIYTIIILSVVLYGCDSWSVILNQEHWDIFRIGYLGKYLRWAGHVARMWDSACRFWYRGLKERDHFEDLGLDGG